MITATEYNETDDADSGADELDLSADDSLPWLESDEEEEGAGGIDTAQVVGFVVILFAILALMVGSVWYFGSRSGDADLIADGSTIDAPDGPIKERPENPGGKEFEGTGNVAPVVGEGGAPEGVMATDDGSERADDGEPDESVASEPIGIGVQLAAYRSRARAEQGWSDISRRTEALSGLRYRIEEGVVDIGTVYRLQAVAGDRAAADRLCETLKSDGIDCQVKP